MKKLFALFVLAGMITFIACRPSSKEKSAKAIVDSIQIADSLENVAAVQQIIPDSTAKATVIDTDQAWQNFSIKYDYGGIYGYQGIADGAEAYLGERLIGKASAKSLNQDQGVEVDIKHFSNVGNTIYHGTTFFNFVNGNRGESVTISGEEKYIIFNNWPIR